MASSRQMPWKVRVGGVPEHFNTPWKTAISSGEMLEKGIDVDFVEYPGGTGAMCSALSAGEVDIALLLTEGAITHALNNKSKSECKVKLVGFYVDSPLLWGVHVGAESNFNNLEDLKGGTSPIFAISRFGSGSHLMSYVLMENLKLEGQKKELEFEVVKNLNGAKQELPKNNRLVFMWEHFMTAPFVKSGIFKRIGDQPTPWPCFIIAVREGFLHESSPTKDADEPLNLGAEKIMIAKMLEVVKQQCISFKARGDVTVDELNKKFSIEKDLAKQWLESVSFKCEPGLTLEELKPVAETLFRLGKLDQKPSESDLSELILQL